ncbi:hypothetical protein ACKWTF_015434 [Chironomus riparius]
MSDKTKLKFGKDLQFQNLGYQNDDILTDQREFSHELTTFKPQDYVSQPQVQLELPFEKEQDEDICSWFQNIKTNGNVELMLNQFETIANALDFLNCIECSNLSKKVTTVIFSIEERIATISQSELNILGNKFSSKSLILIILSNKCQSPIIFWKSDAIGYFLSLKGFSSAACWNDKKIYEFVGDFLIKSLETGHLGIFKFISAHQDIKIIELHFLADNRDYNLLLLAAEAGDIQLCEILLKLGINTNSTSKGINAQSLAYKNGHFDVLLMFLENNLTYPSTIDINGCSSDIIQFHRVATSLHAAIKNNNEDKVVQIIAQNPHQRHFYNSKNQSAPTIALINKQTDMYKLLIAQHIHFGPHENTDAIMKNFEYHERRDLREFHNQHAKDLPEKHLNALMTSSVVAHDATDVNRKPDLVMGAFKLLNEILLIRVILKVVAASKKLQMIFDFNRESVEVADPTVDSNTFGLFYLTGRIYIGAVRLLNNATKCETLGTMAHELCHYAMHLTFENDANPYRKDDEEAKAEFQKISEHCEENCKANGIIKAVYDEYPDEAHHAELIVRVPHILAFYSDEPEEIEKCQQTFKPLFDFYEYKVVSEMEKALPDIEARVDREIEQKDKKITTLVKIIVILIVSSLFAGGLLVLILYKPEIKFDELSSAKQEIVRASIVNYKGVEVKFCDLFLDNSTVYRKLSSDHLRTLLDKDILDLNDPLLRFTDQLITHKWTNLSKSLRQKFLNSNFIFQNQSLKFIDFYNSIPEAFDQLTSDEIHKVLDGSDLVIGTLHKPAVDNYIERKFSIQNVEGIKNLTEIINQNENSKMLILSAVAGAGKTVTFEYMTVEIKERFPSRWVSYVDLKKHTDFYRTSNSINPKELLSKILNLNQKSDFEREIFEKSFESGNLNLLWNGFDEISPTYSTFIIDIIKNIKRNTKNIQFISTRPSYAHDLSSNLTINPHLLIPLKKNEQQKFLVDFFKSQSQNDSIINQNIEKVQKILKDINIGGSRDFKTPLMLRMVAEIQDDPKLINSTNLYQVYELFIIKKNQIWFDKGELAKTASTDLFLTESTVNIAEIHQKFALLQEKSIFESLILKLMNLKILKITETLEQPLFPEITRIGILHIENENKFEFSHRTFAEFFIAQYLIKNVYSSSDDDVSQSEVELRLTLFYKIITNYDSKLIINLMHSHVKSQNQKQRAFSEPISEVLRTKFKDFIFNSLKLFDNQLNFLLDFFKKDHEILTELLQINDKETLYTKTFDPNEHISCKVSQIVKEMSRKYLSKVEFNHFMTGVDQKGKILMGTKVCEMMNKIEQRRKTEEVENSSYECNDYENESTEDEETTEDNPNLTKDNPNSTKDNPNSTEDYPNSTEDNPNSTEVYNEDNEDEADEEASGTSSEDDEPQEYEEDTSESEDDYQGSGEDHDKITDASEQDYDDNSGSGNDSTTQRYDPFDYTTNEAYKKSIENKNKNSFWLFIDNLKQNLTQTEVKELLFGLTSPNFFGFTYEFSQYFDLNEFVNVWKEIEVLNLTKVEKKNLFSKSILNAAKCIISGGPHLNYYIDCGFIFRVIAKFATKLLTNSEIYEIFYNGNIFHKVVKLGNYYSGPAFNTLFEFFQSVTNSEQQKQIYEKFDDGDDGFSQDGLPPLRILHLKLLNMRDQGDPSDYFSLTPKADVQKYFSEVPQFLIHLINKYVICFKVARFLGIIFDGDEVKLQNILRQKIRPKKISIFEYFDGNAEHSSCLSFFSDLLKKIELKINT